MSSTPKNPYKRKQAIALQYANGEAPRVVASGAGEIAERILALAKEHDVPIREDDALADILARLDVGFEIPPETFRAVAEILAFLYRADEEWKRRQEKDGDETKKA